MPYVTETTILTASSNSPGNPVSPIQPPWTNRSYHGELKGFVAVVKFEPLVSARHVAVFTNSGNFLAFHEIRIYTSSKSNAMMCWNDVTGAL